MTLQIVLNTIAWPFDMLCDIVQICRVFVHFLQARGIRLPGRKRRFGFRMLTTDALLWYGLTILSAST